MRRKYDFEFKEKVAREAINVNNISATAKKYSVSAKSVSKWSENYKMQLGMSEISKSSNNELISEKDIKRLRQEVIELRKQLDITKNDLKDAIIIIGEKDLFIRKLTRDT